MDVKVTRTKVIAGLILLAGVGFFSRTPVNAYSGEELTTQANISLSTARSTGLKVRPGRITKEELERESGGSGLRYSFVIKHGAKAYEVGIDARTGAVLENIVEPPNAD
jgi:uncharacterized membrane protein YkoI